MSAAVLSRMTATVPGEGALMSSSRQTFPGEQFDVFTRPHSDIETPILGISDRYLGGVP